MSRPQSPAEKEEKKAVVRRWFQAVNEHDLATLEELLHPRGFVWHSPALPQGVAGREAILESYSRLFSASPDVRFMPEEMLVDGGKVTVRWETQGTHRGEYLGVPATGKTVGTTGATIFSVGDGKIQEAWVYSDRLGLLQQLGATPS